jgi:hypothetical protein
VTSTGEPPDSGVTEKEVVVARLASWKAPLDLSMAPIFMVLALVPNTIVDYQAKHDGSDYLLKLFLVKTSALVVWLTILKFMQAVFLKKSPREINLFILGALGAVIGAIAGAYVHYLSLAVGLPVDNTTFVRRLISTSIIGFSWLPVTVVLSSSFNRIRNLSAELESATYTKLRQKFKNSGFFQSYISKLNSSIERKLILTTENINNKISELSSTPEITIQNIEQIIQVLETRELRNLSNELENKISLPKPRSYQLKVSRFFRFLSFILQSIFMSFKTSPLNPKIFTYIVTICTIGIAIRRNQSVPVTLEYGLFVGSLTFACSYILVLAWKLKNKIYIYFAIFFTALNIYAPIEISRYLDGRHFKFTEISGGKYFPLLWGTLILVCLLLGHMGNASINASRNIFNFNKFNNILSAIENEMIHDQDNLINHKWAIHIHGKVQTRLSTSVLAIRQALASNNVDSVISTLNSIQSLLMEPSAGIVAIHRGLQKEVISRLAPWEGLLESDFIIDQSLLDADGVPVQVIGDVIEEIVSNSSRHGGATEIRIEIWRMGSKKLLIRAEDNAINPPPISRLKGRGVGTSIFNTASDGRWSLKRDVRRAKTVFEIRIDLSNSTA